MKTKITTSLQIHPTKLLPDIDFADDLVLLDQDETEAIEQFQTIEFCAQKVGLSNNNDKAVTGNVDNANGEVIERK